MLADHELLIIIYWRDDGVSVAILSFYMRFWEKLTNLQFLEQWLYNKKEVVTRYEENYLEF